MALIYVLIIILGIFTAGWMLHLITSEHSQATAKMQRELESLSRRLKDLEEAAAKKRNPYRTDVGLEDAIAQLLDIKNTLDYADIRSTALHGVLKQIRSNPGSYNEDAPNGKREIGGTK